MLTLFYFFIFLQVCTSTFIYFSLNPVHSIMLLILLFFEAAVILSLFNLEFISILFIIIYVGAIAILFLFVLMMLQLKLNDLEVLFFLSNSFSFNALFVIFFFSSSYFTYSLNNKNFNAIDEVFNESFILSQFLYNYSILCFLLAGILLLLALIGSIVISLDYKKLSYNIIFKKLIRTSKFITFFK